MWRHLFWEYRVFDFLGPDWDGCSNACLSFTFISVSSHQFLRIGLQAAPGGARNTTPSTQCLKLATRRASSRTTIPRELHDCGIGVGCASANVVGGRALCSDWSGAGVTPGPAENASRDLRLRS